MSKAGGDGTEGVADIVPEVELFEMRIPIAKPIRVTRSQEKKSSLSLETYYWAAGSTVICCPLNLGDFALGNEDPSPSTSVT
ncbi:MAG: hypothetical protein R3C56_41965 [Pirellulaceae bacterium]